MEHLLFTTAPAPIVVRYHGTEDWDGGDFLTYPQRKGLDISIWEPVDSQAEIDTGGRSFQDISSFLQVWLFFGLLESVLRIKIPREDFTRQTETEADGGEIVITTTKLKRYLEDWRHRITRLSASEKDREGDFLWKCISEAVVVHDNLNHQLLYGEDTADSQPLLESLFCVTLLTNALLRALVDILPDASWSLNLKSTNQVRLLTDRMEAAGWCPYTVSILQMQLQPDAEAFVFSLGTLRTQQDHSLCLSTNYREIGGHCVASQTERAAPLKAKHVTANCECQPLGPPMQEIIELIEDGWTPVVAIATSDDNDDVEIYVKGIELEEIDAKNEFGDFFALSHVWTDGLGNSEQNTILTCQARKLANLLHNLDGTVLGQTEKIEVDPKVLNSHVTIDFWLDTLCIPVQPQHQELRERCIGQMHKIYLTAAGVLVLDPDLQQLTRNSKPVELVGRLVSSFWRTRLWTYQEGALPLFLYFAGQDCLFELGETEAAFPVLSDSEDDENPDRMDRDLVEYQVARSLMTACRDFISPIWTRGNLKDSPAHALWRMLLAISQRGTSRPDDEAICIATFMGIDPTPVVNALPEHRMTTLLQNLPCLPKLILFAWGPRQQKPGFRWAPLSFLAPYGIRQLVIFALTYAPDPAEPKIKISVPPSFLHPKGLGLAAFFTGVKFSYRPGNPTPEDFSVRMPDNKIYLFTFYDSGLGQTWADISPDNFPRSAAVIFSRPEIRYSKQVLLVEMLDERTEEGYERCSWRGLLMANNIDYIELSEESAKSARKHEYKGEYVPFQWWVID
jgi:Heterokaryon incompatibility protein (HET)